MCWVSHSHLSLNLSICWHQQIHGGEACSWGGVLRCAEGGLAGYEKCLPFGNKPLQSICKGPWSERKDDGCFRRKLCNLFPYLGLPGYSLSSRFPWWSQLERSQTEGDKHMGLQNPKQGMTSSAQQSPPGQAGAKAPLWSQREGTHAVLWLTQAGFILPLSGALSLQDWFRAGCQVCQKAAKTVISISSIA